MSFFASRMSRFGVSASQAATQRARELEATGKRIVKMTAGEPDFPTPDNVKMAAIEAMVANDTKYPPIPGTNALRQAVCDKFKRDQGFDFSIANVCIAGGVKQVLNNAFMATLDEGDEVIIPAPYWTSYPDMVKMAGGEPVVISAGQNQGFRIRPEQLEEAITPRTKWFLICQPSNPSGAVYSKDELQALADVLLRHEHVRVLTDDIYEHLVFDGREFHTISGVEPKLADRTLIVNGVSKAYAMTGWRVGYAAGLADIIKMMSQVQSQAAGGVSSISQAAAVEALNGDQAIVATRTADLQRRRDLLCDIMEDAPGIACHKPEGAMYVYANVAGMLGKKTPGGKLLETDTDVTLYLLDDAGVAVVQGAAYGLSPYIRISFVISDAELREGAQAIVAAAKALTD